MTLLAALWGRVAGWLAAAGTLLVLAFASGRKAGSPARTRSAKSRSGIDGKCSRRRGSATVKLTTLALLISITALTAGCAGRNSGDFCDVASPQRPSAATVAAMTREEKTALVKHNEHGERHCGWTT